MYRILEIKRTRALVWIGLLGMVTWIAFGQASMKQAAHGVASDDPRLQEYEKPGVRFDMLVRDDFFAGMFGNTARLDRGMAFCEAVLKKHPHHAEALVWHGGGLLTRASIAYAKGDSSLGDKLFQQGLREMNNAEKYEPDNIGVKIGRAATLIGISQSGFNPSDAQGRQLLTSAVLDYQKVLAWEQPRFMQFPMHDRGELLFGLASGWSMLGDSRKATQYLQQITRDCKGSHYETEARSWLPSCSICRGSTKYTVGLGDGC